MAFPTLLIPPLVYNSKDFSDYSFPGVRMTGVWDQTSSLKPVTEIGRTGPLSLCPKPNSSATQQRAKSLGCHRGQNRTGSQTGRAQRNTTYVYFLTHVKDFQQNSMVTVGKGATKKDDWVPAEILVCLRGTAVRAGARKEAWRPVDDVGCSPASMLGSAACRSRLSDPVGS